MNTSFFNTHYNLSLLNEFLSKKPNAKKFILLDQNTYSHSLPLLIENVEELCGAEILEVEAGEENKCLAIAEELCLSLIDANADRDSILISLGGGVITDLGGFIASIFKRGIQHIAIPTTLLAMVDAAIGGKNAVNLKEIKNQIGTFNHNTITCFEFKFLETLPHRHLLNGLAEMIKIALLSDEDLWNKIKETPFLDLKKFNSELIERCIFLKETIVEKDPYEKNERKILNLGHTIAHAIESLALVQGKDILHGEAVASGLYYAIKLSEKKLSFSSHKAREIYSYLSQNYSIYNVKENIDFLFNYMLSDKKNFENQIHFILLSDIAKPNINYKIIKEDFLEL